MTQNCKPSAILPFDQSADHSSVPTKFRTAVPRPSRVAERRARSSFAWTVASTVGMLDSVGIALIPQSSNLFVRLARGIRSQ